jgi:hypothetical protein
MMGLMDMIAKVVYLSGYGDGDESQAQTIGSHTLFGAICTL